MANTSVIFGPNNTGLVLPKNGLVGVGGAKVAAASNIAFTPAGGLVSTDVQAAIVEAHAGFATVTLAQMLALTGSDGQIVWNSTYHAAFQWVNDRWRPFGTPDPRYGFHVHDEFIGYASASQMGWTATGSSNLGNLGTHSGVWYVEPSTASTRAFINTYVAGMAFGVDDLYLETMIQIPTLATGVQDFCASFGFNDNSAFDANGACTDGAYFTYNRAVNGVKWITNTAQGATTTTTNTTSANIVAGTWYRLTIIVSTSSANVQFYVNGALVATHTTNIPSGAANSTGIMWKVDKTVGSAAVDMYVDYFECYGFFNGARVS